MPSKQARAYHWAWKIAAWHLLTDNILSLNQFISCDQELTMYQPLREIMLNSDCLKRACNLIDIYYLIQKEWKDKVECKVSSIKSTSILNILKQKVSNIFNYVDTVEELTTPVKHYYKYYKELKKDLKSDQACELIEVVFSAIQNNFQYVAYCYFKDVCIFDFKGGSIVEADNSSLKIGSLSVSTSMKIHTLARTQLKIGENQTIKNHK